MRKIVARRMFLLAWFFEPKATLRCLAPVQGTSSSSNKCLDGNDCDDNDEMVHPGANEICDGIDNNCKNGTDDEADTDLDGVVDRTCGGDDCDDEDGTIYPGAIEICNGRDDDCDGASDEGFECVFGKEIECITECGSKGTRYCTDECTSPSDISLCKPPPEICNSKDDDCDNEVDEDFPCIAYERTSCTTICGSVGEGYCTASCELPLDDDCNILFEECNGEDDDCDGQTDESFDCVAGEEVICQINCGSDTITGTGICSDKSEIPSEELCSFSKEICDDLIDNDCDEQTDCYDTDCSYDYACGWGL